MVAFLDRVGKGATMLMFGAIIMIACHLSFAFLLPAFPSKTLALVLIVVLGVSFSLVPASLWPSVPKIIDPLILGSAYSLIFWIQNVGLCFVPLIIGIAFEKTGGYVVPMIIFASFGVLAFNGFVNQTPITKITLFLTVSIGAVVGSDYKCVSS